MAVAVVTWKSDVYPAPDLEGNMCEVGTSPVVPPGSYFIVGEKRKEVILVSNYGAHMEVLCGNCNKEDMLFSVKRGGEISRQEWQQSEGRGLDEALVNHNAVAWECCNDHGFLADVAEKVAIELDELNENNIDKQVDKMEDLNALREALYPIAVAWYTKDQSCDERKRVVNLLAET